MRTIAAISAGSPRRPIGGGSRRCDGRSGTPGSPRWLSIVPGTTQLTVIWCRARSSASALVNPARPALAVTTCARSDAPLCAVWPPMFTIVPPPALIRCGSAACAQRNAPSRTMARTCRHSSYFIFSNEVSYRTAALLTRKSRRPNRFTVASTSAWTSAGFVMSAMCRAAFDPIISTVFSASVREVRAFTITDAPPAASEREIARPMLRAAPVTSATLPASSLPDFIPALLGKLASHFLSTHFRQPGCKRWNIDDEQDQQHHAGDERQPGEVDVAHARSGGRNALHHEEQQAERRHGVAHLEREQHDEPEPRQVEPQRLGEREEDRRREQHLGERVHEAAEEDDHADHDVEHVQRRDLEAGGPGDQATRAAGERQHLGERGRAEDHQERHHRDAQRAVERLDERFPGHLAVAGGEHDNRHRAERRGL